VTNFPPDFLERCHVYRIEIFTLNENNQYHYHNFFRFIRKNTKGSVGPAIAMARAKRLTIKPAVEILTSKCSATSGSMPMTLISVLIVPKTSIARINISKFLEYFINCCVTSFYTSIIYLLSC